MDSERELGREMDAAASRLDPGREWTDRIAAMVRVEALLLGGAAEWDSFPAHLAKLRGPLTAQVADRRSAVVRQAAHLLVILAAELGGEFERDASHFVPELFKCVVITVQIIAESGDFGIRGILHNCQARHLLPKLCEAASKDRSVKLRSLATGWLRLVVGEWESLGGNKAHELLEEAIAAMLADGAPDVRAGARKLYSAYERRFPEFAPRLRSHPRVDAGAKRLIAREVAEGEHDDESAYAVVERGTLIGAAAEQRAQTAAGGSRPAAGILARAPSTSGGRRRAEGAAEGAEPGRARERRAEADSFADGRGGGSAPGRARERRAEASHAAESSSREGAKPAGERTSRLAGGAARERAQPGTGDARGDAAGERSAAPRESAAPRVRPRVAPEDASASAGPSGASGDRSLSVSSAISNAASVFLGSPPSSSATRRPGASVPPSWEAKTAAMEALAQRSAPGRTRPPGARAEPAAADAIASALAAALSDAHHRVARAALEACAELVALAPVAFERNLESLCPALFPKLVDAKESIRAQASAALAAVGDAFSPDALLPALLESLEQSKAPRAKTGVLEFALYVLSGQGGGADPEGAPHRPAEAGSLNLRRWVARVAPLLTSEKAHGPLRAAAAAGLAAVHARGPRGGRQAHRRDRGPGGGASGGARRRAARAGDRGGGEGLAAAERRAGERREEPRGAKRRAAARGKEERVTERGARESARESDPSDPTRTRPPSRATRAGRRSRATNARRRGEAKGSGGSSDPPAPLPSLAPATPPPPSAPPRETRLPPGNPERSSRSEFDAPHAPRPHASPPLPAHPATRLRSARRSTAWTRGRPEAARRTPARWRRFGARCAAAPPSRPTTASRRASRRWRRRRWRPPTRRRARRPRRTRSSR